MATNSKHPEPDDIEAKFRRMYEDERSRHPDRDTYENRSGALLRMGRSRSGAIRRTKRSNKR